MSVWGRHAGYTLGPTLPPLPSREAPLEALEPLAIARRLDVAAARKNLDAMGAALSLARTTRWVGTVNVSVETGRLRTGHFSFGPSVALEIPLFDQRQAQIAKLEAYERVAARDLEALAIAVRADVRAARACVIAAREVVSEYMAVVVPLRERIVQLSQEQYDAMLLGVYQLLSAKQGELAPNARRSRRSATTGSRAAIWSGPSALAWARGRRPSPTTPPSPCRPLPAPLEEPMTRPRIAALLVVLVALAVLLGPGAARAQRARVQPATIPVVTPNGSTLPFTLRDGVKSVGKSSTLASPGARRERRAWARQGALGAVTWAPAGAFPDGTKVADARRTRGARNAALARSFAHVLLGAASSLPAPLRRTRLCQYGGPRAGARVGGSVGSRGAATSPS